MPPILQSSIIAPPRATRITRLATVLSLVNACRVPITGSAVYYMYTTYNGMIGSAVADADRIRLATGGMFSRRQVLRSSTGPEGSELNSAARVEKPGGAP